MSSDVSINVKNVSKRYHIYDQPIDRLKQSIFGSKKQYYKEFDALKSISFEIKKGETVGLIGRNGSGKSTLLQIICGTLTPTTGNVSVNGRVAALLELGAGFNPEFTGRENVYLNAAILGLSKQEIDDKFSYIEKFADIGAFIEQPVKTYSSGMYVRLAFSVAINVRPDILVVDEALAVGDMAFQAKCMTAITRLKEAGATVLFVSHDIGTVKSLCAKCIYLDSGQLKLIGKASDVAEKYIQDMREEGNVGVEKIPPLRITQEKECLGNSKGFKKSKSFDEKAELFRYGVGGARIAYAEILNEQGETIVNVDFNQKVKIVVYFETDVEVELSCNYYVADAKKNLVIGAGMRLVGKDLIKSKKGGKYIVSYTTKMPLHEGNYSIQLQLVKPLVVEQSAEFIDVIDDAIIFKVSRKSDCRIWTQVHLENSIEVDEVC